MIFKNREFQCAQCFFVCLSFFMCTTQTCDLSPVSCLLSPVSCLLSCLLSLSPVSCLLFPVSLISCVLSPGERRVLRTTLPHQEGVPQVTNIWCESISSTWQGDAKLPRDASSCRQARTLFDSRYLRFIK